MSGTQDYGVPLYLSGSGVVKNSQGSVKRFLPCTSSSGTIALYDNATTNSGTNFLPTFPVTAGTPVEIGAAFTNGCYAVLANCTGTFVYR